MTQEQTRQARGQAEDKRTSKEGRKRDKSRSKEDKRDKTEANTPQAFKPPNSTRAQKPHKPRKAPNPHKYTPTPQNPLKTPLKREIEPYSSAMHHKQSRGEDKRHGTHHKRTRADRWQVLNPRTPAHLLTSGHDKSHHQRSTRHPTPAPYFKNILVFRPFRSPKIPRKHQSTPKIYSFLTYFDLIRCPFGVPETLEAGANECRLAI